jgi:hypothetical protein
VTTRDQLSRVLGVLFAALVLLVGGAGIGAAIDDDGDGRPDRYLGPVIKKQDVPAPAAVAVDGPDRDAEPDTALELDREAREVVQNATQTPERFDVSGGLRGDDERGPVAKHEGPLATPTFPGCATRILPTNWSSRTVPMSRVDGIGLHYTAGGNRPGLSDMNGLTAFASSPVAGVSWHFLIDAEGNCYYQTPLGKKAWTIGNLNSQTVNIEVIGRGNEPNYPAESAGARKLAQVVQRLGRILNIPMKVGAVSNCTVTRPGIITHWQGGTCAGAHHDIRPYNIVAVTASIRATGSGIPDTPAEVAACKSVRYHRGVARRGGHDRWQDVITNRQGQRVARHKHVAAKKAFLRKRKVDERRVCT